MYMCIVGALQHLVNVVAENKHFGIFWGCLFTLNTCQMLFQLDVLLPASFCFFFAKC